ncbi:MAG: peptidase [Halobacteriota archaeon]
MTVLITGYEPFGEFETNPTADLAGELDGSTIGDHAVVGSVLPVAFDSASDRLAELFDEHDFAVAIATGLAAGRTAICVERVAVNVHDAVTTPDNDDRDPTNEPIDPTGPDAHLSTLPVSAIADRLLNDGIPARVSNTAGTHLCNDALYSLAALADAGSTEPPVGFVHVPLTPDMAATAALDDGAARGGSVRPSLPSELHRRSIELAVETTLDRR